MKAVVIGCGGIANYAHLPNLKALGVEIVAVCDLVEEKALAASQKFGGRPFTDFNKALEEEADFAVIATPPNTHYEIAKTALESGKHVFLEKPLAANLVEARKLHQLTLSYNEKVVPGLCLRFNPMFIYVASRIGALGKLHYVYRLAMGNASGVLSPSGWVRFREKSGGMMVENMIHMIDTFRWYAGDFASVSSVFSTFTSGSDIEDNVSVSVRFASGAVGSMAQSWTSSRSLDAWGIVGEKGSLLIDGYVDGTVYENMRDIRVTEAHKFDGGGSYMYLNEMRGFIEYLQGGNYPVSTLDALRAQELAEAARLSSEEKREVSLNEL
ncbi:MAG: Gfo/Idh/MocA family protein [Thermoprotei archaeon]